MEIIGLPLHPLIVHATVIIVPLTAVGAIAISLIPWARVRYAELVLLAAILAPILTFVTQRAGQDLYEERFAGAQLSGAEALEHHVTIGGQLLVWTIGLLVGVVALFLGQRMVTKDHPRGRLVLAIGSVLSIFFGLASVVQVIRIGHAGATAVWGG
jgi:hypothetical protein